MCCKGSMFPYWAHKAALIVQTVHITDGTLTKSILETEKKIGLIIQFLASTLPD